MGDPQIEKLFRETFAVILAKVSRVLGRTDEAADVAQETFVRLVESGIGDREPAVKAAWVYLTSTRIAVDRLRRSRLGVEALEDGPAVASDSSGVDEVVAARQHLAALARSATPRELEVAVLCRLDGMTQLEAAEVSGLSERTVRRLLARFDARDPRRPDGRKR